MGGKTQEYSTGSKVSFRGGGQPGKKDIDQTIAQLDKRGETKKMTSTKKQGVKASAAIW